MTRFTSAPSALLAVLASTVLGGCELLAAFDDLSASEYQRLTLPRVNRVQRPADEVVIGPPDISRIERDPFLTAAEDEKRRRDAMPKAAATVARSRPRTTAARPVSKGLEVIRRELDARVPLIITGQNGRNIAILSDDTVLEEGSIIEGFYVVRSIETDGIQIGSTDNTFNTRLPFARTAPEGDRNPWDLTGR